MVKLPPFIVHCERIGRRNVYYVRFQYNSDLINKIKSLPEESRKWNAAAMAWEISTYSLFLLIKKFKGINEIHFDFENEDSRKVFIEQIKKIQIEEAEKRKFIEELNVKKEHWVQYKEELEKDYLKYSDKLHSLLKNGIKLYPHQIVAAMFMNVTRNTLISHEMGLGKTASSILYVEMNGFEKVIVITPNSLKFNYYYEVKKFTDSQVHIIGWKKNTCSIEDAKYVIVNYDFFNPAIKSGRFQAKWKKLGIDKIDCVICDECFTYNTKISTNMGEIPIGEIVEKKLNVKVFSYDHKLKKIESKSIKRYLYKGVKKVVLVRLSDGTTIRCTPDHKFYSFDRDEYIPIKDFKCGEKIIKKKNISDSAETLQSMWNRISDKGIYNKRILFSNLFNEIKVVEKGKGSVGEESVQSLWDRISVKKKRTTVLLEKVFDNFNSKRKCKEIINNEGNVGEYLSNGSTKLCRMWRGIFYKGKNIKKVLFNQLFSKMENGTGRNKREDIYERNFSENIECDEKGISKQSEIKGESFQKNEEKQSNVSKRDCRENETEINWKNIPIKRWKWSDNNTTIKTFFSNIWYYIYGIRVFNTNKKTIKGNELRCGVTTNTLQDRYWNPQIKISDRNRWEFSQDQEMEIFRQEEDGNIEIIWVESIEVLESRDRREFGECGNEGERVYDLEIADNHNFFANGVLVHNCQKIKNNKSNTYKNFKRTFNKKIFNGEKESKIFLSGTPAPNRAYELYTVLNQISYVDFPTKKYFYEYYCGMTRSEMGWGYVADEMETRFEELYHKIAPFTHRKRKVDALKDLPDKTYQRIILEMTAQEEKTYNDIENSVANDFVLHPTGNPLTIMIRLRQYLGLLKINHIIELVDSILETGEKVVIVDYYKETLYELHKKLGNISALHTGDQTVEERSDIVKKFQDPNSDLKVFLASIQTANYGLTLTAASKLFIITLPYSVGEYDQVSDRLHRIGQKDAVNIYPLIFPDTIDDYVYSSIESKRKEIVKVMDNEDYKTQINESVLSDVINKLKQKHGK